MDKLKFTFNYYELFFTIMSAIIVSVFICILGFMSLEMGFQTRGKDYCYNFSDKVLHGNHACSRLENVLMFLPTYYLGIWLSEVS